MRPIRYLLVALAAFALMGQESCDTETTNEPDKDGGKGKKQDGGGGGSDGGSSSPPVASVGDAITLRGTEDSLRVKVTVVGVVDPVPAGEFDQPASGKRYVGVDLALKNVGNEPYSDSPSNGATLVLSDSSQENSTFLSEGCEDPGSVTLSPGAKRRICLPYEVPMKTKAAQFQFALDSGFAPQTGEWKLR